MKIKKAKFRGIRLFHEEQTLDNLSWFNLFIGPNGSGKSNCLKILSGSEFEYQQNRTDDLKVTPNFSCHVGEGQSSLEIQYETTQFKFADEWNPNYVPQSKKIVFRDGKLLEGNILSLRQVYLINKLGTDLEFYRDLIKCTREDNDPELETFTLLAFCIFYVFGRHYHFGDFQNNERGQVDERLLERSYPSGVMNCAKLVTQFLLAAIYPYPGSVVLFDEPELHLEPRAIRKIFHFFVWFNSRWKKSDEMSEGQKRIFDMVEYVRCNSDPQFKFTTNIRHAHGLYMPIQMFVASHSPVLINEHVRINANIYEFQSIMRQQGNGSGTYPDRYEGIFSNIITKINADYSSLLENLGCKGSDLLQTNGVVWVEGPSDIIFIKKWLDMYAFENSKNILLQGKDYEFQMYGGTILDSICLIKGGMNAQEEYKKLVTMFSFSRNAFVVIDSDARKEQDGSIKDMSKFVEAKQFIKAQIQTLQLHGKNLGLWYKENNAGIRTIEDYLDDESKNILPSGTKKIRAQKIIESWEKKDKKLSDFPNQLTKEIRILFNTIESWNA